MNFRRTLCSVCVSTLAISACSTSYAPRPGPRVAIVMQGGTPGYQREGRFYPGGFFGGDLDEAVRGNAEAESHARAYRTGMIGGFVTTMAGIVSGVGGGMLYSANTGGPESERDPTAQAGGAALAIGGIAAYFTGLALLANAQPHLWDAINTYNDGVPPAGGPPPPYLPYAPAPFAPSAPAAPSSPGPSVPAPATSAPGR